MNDIRELYFSWIVQQIDDGEHISYDNLLSTLFDREFTYTIPMDGNRYEDGIELRYKFGYYEGYDAALISAELDGNPCNILEMMVALSIRCEDIMDDSEKGNRTAVWFWDMISSLGLEDYDDDHFDQDEVDQLLDIFLSRNYAPNGEGGLFTLQRPFSDLRTKEIWMQMMWHINEMIF